VQALAAADVGRAERKEQDRDEDEQGIEHEFLRLPATGLLPVHQTNPTSAVF
jgi:hypothetical protein